MNSVFDTMEHPGDTMHGVECLLDMVNCLLVNQPRDAELVLTPAATSGLTYLCQGLSLALGEAREKLENPPPAT